MKTTGKLWSMMLCVCLLLTMLCTMPAAATEDYSDSSWSLTGATVETENPPAGISNYVMLTVAGETDAVAAKNHFDVVPGKLNVVSFYYKSNADALAQLVIWERDAAAESLESTLELRLPTTGDEWMKCTYGYVPKEGSTKITFRMVADASYAGEGAQTVCLAAVSVTEDADGILEIPAGETGYVGAPKNVGGMATGDLLAVNFMAKAAEESTAKLAVQVDSVISADAMGSKTLAADWCTLSFSGVSFLGKGTALKIVAGNALVSVKAASFTKDTNLLKNASLEDTTTIAKSGSNLTWLFSESGMDATIATDGDCPDGSNYLHLYQISNKRRLYTTIMGGLNNVEPLAGEKFLFSIWYRANVDSKAEVRVRQRAQDDTYTETPLVLLPSTNGEWKKVELTFTVQENLKNLYIYFGNNMTTSLRDDEYVDFDLPCLKRIEAEGKLGFYQNIGTEDSTSTLAYGTLLGEPVDTAAGANTITATYTSAGDTATGTVIIAAYTKDASSPKQLISIQIGDSKKATLTEIPENCEIRAFVWDGISGLKSLSKAIKTTK